MPEYVSPGLTIQPAAPTIAGGRDAPVGVLASDAGVNAAYQALMQAINNAGMDKDTFARQLTDNITRSQTERQKAKLGAQQSLSDRGLLNSGAALQQGTELDTQYDAYDNQLRDFYGNAQNGIDRNITTLEGAYNTAQLDGSSRWTAAQAAAADAAIKQQQNLDAINQQTQSLMAMLAPLQLQGDPVFEQMPAPTMAVNPSKPPTKPPPVVRPTAAKPVSGSTGYLTQAKVSGPQ
jgi:hypothetical protein